MSEKKRRARSWEEHLASDDFPLDPYQWLSIGKEKRGHLIKNIT